MEINIRKYGELSIVDLVGRLDTVTSPGVEAAITKLLEAECRKIIINLSETEWVSSSGLRVLLVTAKKELAMDGKMIICQPNEVVKEIFDISGFSTILNVVPSEARALADMES